MLTLARIDDRLVHGQVVEGWIPHLRAELIIVVGESGDETQEALMRLALPDGVELEILAPEAAARHPALSEKDPRRVLVLAPGPVEVLELLRRGARLSRVNVGGLHYTAGRVQLGKAIFLSEDDKRALREIHQRGVVLEGRALPGDETIDVFDLIGEGHA